MLMRRTPVVEEDIDFVLRACQNELSLLSGKILLVTGGSGFVGSYLIESIIAFNSSHKGAPCRLLLPTRSLTATRAKWPHFFGVQHVDWFEWDGRKLISPSDSCDYVIHAASPADPASYMRTPMQAMEDIESGTSAVLHFAQAAGVRAMLYLSSGAAYGVQAPEVVALDEESTGAPDLTDPASCYGEAKRYSELLCRMSGVPVVIARLFAFIGPYQDLRSSFAVPSFIRQALQEKKIRVNSDGSALRTYCYASDLTSGLWKLLLNGTPGELYNVGADAPQISIRELAELVAEEIGHVDVFIDGRIGTGPRSRYIPKTDKFKRIYATQVDLEEGLHRMITSYQYIFSIAQ